MRAEHAVPLHADARRVKSQASCPSQWMSPANGDDSELIAALATTFCQQFLGDLAGVHDQDYGTDALTQP